MIYTPLTVKAMKLSYEAHIGQYDKSGVPYIFHPFHLAEQMSDEFSVCAALLHDTVEDTSVTIEQLEKEFPREVTDAVKLLTHSDDEDYFSYVMRIKTDAVARKVKLADLEHNSDISRIEAAGCGVSEKDSQRLEKYRKAMEILRT
ncbi:MAG TPA: HD domain-containing protein [Ruminococcus flavefaciens]|nr:HD domain-containing protein [Ruminococcus flavefaciens]